jgi:hypothetical protein
MLAPFATLLFAHPCPALPHLVASSYPDTPWQYSIFHVINSSGKLMRAGTANRLAIGH